MKRTIYVVDDQQPLLDLTTRVLRKADLDWDVAGFTTPLAALEAVKADAPDAVLSDQVMPEMQGCELLEQVRIACPNSIRFIMSGLVPMEKLNLITSAHQYIAKPFAADKLRELMRRSFAAQERMIHQGLQSVATSIRSIPSLPQAHHSLLAELKDEKNPGETIARMVGADPGLSIKVLQLANSPLFSHNHVVTDVIVAVNCLGTDLLTATILSQSVFRHYESLKTKQLDLGQMWTHCWETACIAQWLCREKKLPGQSCTAFLAGLLHEVGRFVLMDNFPEQYEAACENATRSKAPLSVHLGETFRICPSQLSAYILELWGLPPTVINAICFMDNPENDPTPGFSMTSALYMADNLASRTFPADAFPARDWDVKYLESIGCADDISIWDKAGVASEITSVSA